MSDDRYECSDPERPAYMRHSRNIHAMVKAAGPFRLHGKVHDNPAHDTPEVRILSFIVDGGLTVAKDETIHLKPGRINHPPAKGTCAECPLRKDSKRGALGGWTAGMYLRGMVQSPADFACHMSKGFDKYDTNLMRSCTGVANFRANVGVPLPLGNARTAMEAAGQNKEDVFETIEEFFNHHDV